MIMSTRLMWLLRAATARAVFPCCKQKREGKSQCLQEGRRDYKPCHPKEVGSSGLHWRIGRLSGHEEGGGKVTGRISNNDNSSHHLLRSLEFSAYEMQPG